MKLSKRITTIASIVASIGLILKILKLVDVPSIIITIALVIGAFSFTYNAFKSQKNKDDE